MAIQSLTLSVPEALYEQIKERAARGRRSIEDETLDLLAQAIPSADARKAVEQASFHEHDVVRVRKDVESDGYAVKKGMTGTIVSVYNSGEAFAVEIPEIKDGPAVVTLNAGAVERIWKVAHE